MITDPKLAPSTYTDASEENPLRFGVNAEHYGYWYTNCDGMPTAMGCGSVIKTSRPYTKFSRKPKASGWLVCYAEDEHGAEDRKIVLAFCPTCTQVVLKQQEKRKTT